MDGVIDKIKSLYQDEYKICYNINNEYPIAVTNEYQKLKNLEKRQDGGREIAVCLRDYQRGMVNFLYICANNFARAKSEEMLKRPINVDIDMDIYVMYHLYTKYRHNVYMALLPTAYKIFMGREFDGSRVDVDTAKCVAETIFSSNSTIIYDLLDVIKGSTAEFEEDSIVTLKLPEYDRKIVEKILSTNQELMEIIGYDFSLLEPNKENKM